MSSIGLSTGTMSAIGGIGLEHKGIVGEALGAGNACKFGSTGLVEQAVSTEWLVTGSVGGQIDFDGIVVQDYVANDGATMYGKGAIIAGYGAEMVVGTSLWLSATPGILSDVRVAAVDLPVAKVITATDILILR